MITTLLTSVPITRQRTNRRVDSRLLHVLKLLESHVSMSPPCPPWPMLSGGHLTLDWAPCPRQSAHIGQWSRPKLPRLPPASCVRSPRSRPFLPLAPLPTVSSNIVAQARKLNIGVILLALAVNVSLRLILGYQIAYLGRKISSLHLILVVK